MYFNKVGQYLGLIEYGKMLLKNFKQEAEMIGLTFKNTNFEIT